VANWGKWKNVDAYTTAKILSLCPTSTSCTGNQGRQTLQLLVTAPTTRGVRMLAKPRNTFGTAVSISAPRC
jgi:hypothetical protein